MARLGQYARDESRDGLRHSPHLSRLHRAYFGDDVHDAGLPGSTTWCMADTILADHLRVVGNVYCGR